ncbi:pirin family protein [Pararhizobium sp. IMCC21322]|uniref:pirin family protein n=1 Tax=Pararhizobium sp. IMCC21322 TaxID=3067903 RepID=UPI0027423DDB|nr:pirin family protein [Pararhizobium sp. IMCC21322]
MLTATNKPITIRRAANRGIADHGWLKSAHSFSFAGYNDPDNVHYESLRVINDDRVAADGGFPTHPHKNFEIFSYVLEGALEHKDTLGNGSVVHAGGVQYMSTGSGVSHSEFNPSADDAVHFLQVWLIPDTQNVTPRYEALDAADLDKRGKLALILSPDGADGSIRVQQDALVYAANLDGDEQIEYAAQTGRKLWLQMAAGSLTLNGEVLHEGDGAALDGGSISLEAGQNANFLLFDLAPLQP